MIKKLKAYYEQAMSWAFFANEIFMGACIIGVYLIAVAAVLIFR